jgi:hypothetical protein
MAVLDRKLLDRVLEKGRDSFGFFRLSRGAGSLLMASAILMVAWSFVVPVFEAPDEPAHWQYARYLRHNKKLPEYNKQYQEANSPPLYYLFVAPFARHSEVPPSLLWFDGERTIKLSPLPKVHQNSFSDFAKYWPIRITRLVTILVSLVAVLFFYKGGVEATGNESTGLLAGAFAGFLPQFTFRGMNVSNDAMVTAVSSIAIYILIRMVRRGVNRKIAGCAAFAMAAALLSKTTALFLPVPFALVVLTDKAPLRRRLELLLGTLAMSLVLVAPWLLRNQLLYGDVLARKAMFAAVPGLINLKPITSPYFINPFPWVTAMSFVGVFGWMRVPMAPWMYQAFEALGLLALVGYAVCLARRQISWRLTLILISVVILNILVVIDINLMFDQPQGRYMFPSLAAIAVLAAMGFENLFFWSRAIPPKNRLANAVPPAQHSAINSGQSAASGTEDSSLITHRSSLLSLTWRLPIAALFLLNLYVLFTIVLPVYWPPPQMATSPATTALGPGSLSGLSRVSEDGDLTVTAGNPQISVHADLPAAPYNFLVFKIRGTPTRGYVTGSVDLRMCGCDPAPERRITFNWKCDGAERNVVVPVYLYPEWEGRLADLRLNLLEPPDTTFIGSSLQVSEIQLVSIISDTSGP